MVPVCVCVRVSEYSVCQALPYPHCPADSKAADKSGTQVKSLPHDTTFLLAMSAPSYYTWVTPGTGSFDRTIRACAELMCTDPIPIICLHVTDMGHRT